MSGAMVKKRNLSWENVLERFQHAELDRISAILPGYPHRVLVAALAISVEALDPADRERYHDLAVFPEDTPIPEEALRALWRRDGLDDAGVERLAELFVDRSLAQWDKTGRLVLHDLQADYARARAADLGRTGCPPWHVQRVKSRSPLMAVR